MDISICAYRFWTSVALSSSNGTFVFQHFVPSNALSISQRTYLTVRTSACSETGRVLKFGNITSSKSDLGRLNFVNPKMTRQFGLKQFPQMITVILARPSISWEALTRVSPFLNYNSVLGDGFTGSRILGRWERVDGGPVWARRNVYCKTGQQAMQAIH
uniref:Uncharacterized protein n=1 Tax=Romanomermis culicivorax TaxID=13658 RepID=A0A915HPX8_ROMCU